MRESQVASQIIKNWGPLVQTSLDHRIKRLLIKKQLNELFQN